MSGNSAGRKRKNDSSGESGGRLAPPPPTKASLSDLAHKNPDLESFVASVRDWLKLVGPERDAGEYDKLVRDKSTTSVKLSGSNA